MEETKREDEAGRGSEVEEGEKKGEETELKVTGFQMFHLTIVNAYGTQDVKKLPNDGTTLRLTSTSRVDV